MRASWPDEDVRYDAHADAADLCAECGEPGALVEALCDVCRCAGCGAPDAPHDHHGHRLCQPCAVDAGWVEPLARQWSDAG